MKSIVSAQRCTPRLVAMAAQLYPCCATNVCCKRWCVHDGERRGKMRASA